MIKCTLQFNLAPLLIILDHIDLSALKIFASRQFHVPTAHEAQLLIFVR